MSQMGPNVVQAEFLHVGSLDQTIASMQAEYNDRLLWGAPIKTSVRFFDEGGFVTSYIVGLDRKVGRRDRLLTHISQAEGFAKILMYLELEYLFQKTLREEKLVQRLITEQLLAVAETTREIALEEPDRTFRPIRDDEVYDLRSAAERAKGVLVFLFKPNDLFSDTNEVIAKAI